ncbi:MAG: outer membrane beta-barrel protein, partial [Bacteroidetes bacterium]|nr:outer membrane beta-barrel protein [Bacteroidota bacterium]
SSTAKLNESNALPSTESAASQADQVIIYTHIDRLDYCPYTIDISTDQKLASSELRNSGKPFFDLNIRDNYVKKAELMFGAGFTPAVNIYPDGQNRNDYSLELVAAYEKSRFIIESGIGANYTSESAKYQVNYSSYDSVGYYIGVSSFSIAPGNPDSVIFETSLKSVYDSIAHYQITENTNKFVYLQIPLRIGYRIIEANRFSIDLKAGVLLSLQVYRDVPEVPYQGSDAEQIEVIRQYPDRLKTTWQYTASLGFNYQINRQTRFSLEPVYRQYINSVYSTGSAYPARSPYSFGIRGGIYFHF